MKKPLVLFFTLLCLSMPFAAWYFVSIEDTVLVDPIPIEEQERYFIELPKIKAGAVVEMDTLSREEAIAVGLENAKLFNEYLSLILINTNSQFEDRSSQLVDTAINEAVKLFLNEDSKVILVNDQKKTREEVRIRDFLNQLKTDRNSKLEIKSWIFNTKVSCKVGQSFEYIFSYEDFVMMERSVEGKISTTDLPEKEKIEYNCPDCSTNPYSREKGIVLHEVVIFEY